MASRAQSITVTYVAWDTVNNVGKTGDVANHTLRYVKDGTSSAPTNSATEVDSTNAPGLYKLTLTGTEATCDIGVLAGKSSTTGVSIIPITISFERLPTALPEAAGGLITNGTGTGQISLSSGTVTTGALSAGVITATSIASAAITSAKFATDAIDANALAADAVTEIASAVSKDGYTLSSAGLDSVVVEAGINARQALAVIGSSTAGKASGAGTGTMTYKGLNNSTTRVQASVSSGNRTAVTLTLPS